MKRLTTKADRLQSQLSQFEYLLRDGYILETYKGLNIFTKEEGVKRFLVKIFKNTSSNHIAFTNYRTEASRAEAIQNYKGNFDRNAAYKAELKANPRKSSAANASAAIKEELKKAFPTIKFSVKSSNFSMGDSVDISWTDGPTSKEVDAITDKYQYGHFNGMEDIYENSNRREDIPQAKYVSTHRHQNEEIMAVLPQFIEMLGPDYDGGYRDKPEQILYRIANKTSFPVGAKITGIERTGIMAGFFEDFYKITFDAPEAKEETVFEKVEVPAGEIQIIDYSEKAIAVIGDTKPIKDKLKELGGKFNFRLSCGAGWIFPKTKLNIIQTALSI